jgi:hypothetical protein
MLMPNYENRMMQGKRVSAYMLEAKPAKYEANHFPGEQLSRQFLRLAEHLSASDDPGAASKSVHRRFIHSTTAWH